MEPNRICEIFPANARSYWGECGGRGDDCLTHLGIWGGEDNLKH